MASQSGKLIMVDVYTDWCGWCKRLDRNTFSNAEVVGLASGFVAMKANAEKSGRALARRYRVRGYPTILFLDAGGDLAGRIDGYLGPSQFAQQLKRIKRRHESS